jgi:hypothetical protein
MVSKLLADFWGESKYKVSLCNHLLILKNVTVSLLKELVATERKAANDS